MKGRQIYSIALYRLPVLCWLFSITIMACSQKSIEPPSNPPLSGPTFTNTPYLALGDSYTIGQSVPEADRFPQQLVQALRNKGIYVSAPDYIATTGWTTQNLLSAIASRNPAPQYGLVTLCIGVNDQYQRRDTAEYRKQFTNCLSEAVRLAGGRLQRVFVVSIPDYAATPFGRNLDSARISREIGYFNAINEQVTLMFGISYTNITPGSRDAAKDAALLAPDGLHPSGKEYAKWVTALLPRVVAAF